MKKLACALFLVAGTMAASGPALGALFCSEPSKPYCVEGSGYFDDQSELERCKSDVASYVDDLRRYTACLAEEIHKAGRQSIETVEQFNCRAEGRSFC